jgi:hypothetical protein
VTTFTSTIWECVVGHKRNEVQWKNNRLLDGAGHFCMYLWLSICYIVSMHSVHLRMITHCSLFCSPLIFMALLSCLFDNLPLSPCLSYGYRTLNVCPLSSVSHQACSETDWSSGMTTECKSPSFSTVLLIIVRTGERFRSLFCIL